MDPNRYDNSKKLFYVNSIFRQIQNAIITNPELRFITMIVIGVIVLAIIAKLFLVR